MCLKLMTFKNSKYASLITSSHCSQNALISIRVTRKSFNCVIKTLAPICLANASFARVQVLGLCVSNYVVACTGAVHLPWRLVFSHLLGNVNIIIKATKQHKSNIYMQNILCETHTLIRQLEQVLFGNFVVNGKVHAGRSATVAS